MRRLAIVLALVALAACSAGGFATTPTAAPNARAALPALANPQALTPIATTFSYSAGTISAVNASGTTQDLSNIVLTFDDTDPITSVWGSPWMAWQIAQNTAHYTLTGGTPYAKWASGATMTVSFSPPWQSKNVPTNVKVYSGVVQTLVRCSVGASERAGTISIVNTTGAPIPLRRAKLRFGYAAAIATFSGTPAMALSATRSGNVYALLGGTHDATQLAQGATLTVSFTPTSGVHATSIAFWAACSATPSPTPSASPTPVPTPTPTPAPTLPPGATEFVGFWESWSDTNPSDAFSSLTSVPATVTTTDVAFSIANDNTIAPAQNYYPLLPGANAIHGHGGRLLLSFGGATSQFAITNVSQFVANLKAFQAANPGLYDG